MFQLTKLKSIQKHWKIERSTTNYLFLLLPSFFLGFYWEKNLSLIVQFFNNPIQTPWRILAFSWNISVSLVFDRIFSIYEQFSMLFLTFLKMSFTVKVLVFPLLFYPFLLSFSWWKAMQRLSGNLGNKNDLNTEREITLMNPNLL